MPTYTVSFPVDGPYGEYTTHDIEIDAGTTIRQLARDLGVTIPEDYELRGEYWEDRRRFIFPHQSVTTWVPANHHLHLNVVQGLLYNTRTDATD